MSKETSSYKSILNGMSIFGGVQVIQIIVNLVRGKFIAMFLGPAGSGMASLYTSAAATIQQLASLGLPMSMTREIAQVRDNSERLHPTLKAAKRAILLTAFLGIFVCSFSAWWLSDVSFGSHDYTWQFVLMSFAVGLTLMWQGDQAILQGLREVRLLSRATLVSSIVGLAAGVPLYWRYGIAGIVPAMVIMNLGVWCFYQYALKKSGISYSAPASYPVDWKIVKRMVTFGLLLVVGQLIGSLVVYLSNIYIRISGTLTDLGNFQAATSICTQYVGMIFAAMAMDYFPRLTASIADEAKWKEIVNRQTQLVVLLSAPLTILLMVTAPIIVKLLLTDSYAPTIVLLRWMGVAIFLQSISYPMGYITFAKGNRRLYFWLEGIFANVVYLLTTCFGYYLFGIVGLGIAAITRFAIDIITYYIVNSKVYGFRYTRSNASIIATNALYVIAAFTLTQTTGGATCLALGTILFAIVGANSYRQIKSLLKYETK